MMRENSHSFLLGIKKTKKNSNFFLSKANTTESRMIYEVGLAEARAFAAEAFGL